MKLHLNLKKKWYDMILSGEKKEEYRQVTSYWLRRLLLLSNTKIPLNDNSLKIDSLVLRDFKSIIFSNGYSKNRPQFEIECKSIKVSTGQMKWGAIEGNKYFVFELGNIYSL